jgi:hypothetical protein
LLFLVCGSYDGAVAAHDKIKFRITEEGSGRLVASIKGYPAWAVEVEVFLTANSTVNLAELRIYPREHVVAVHHYGHYWGPGEGDKTGWTGEDRLISESVEERERWSRAPAHVPPGGIPARLVRAINAGELLNMAQRCARDDARTSTRWKNEYAIVSPWGSTDFIIQTGSRLSGAGRQRPGRKGNGVDHYLRWAVLYVEKVHGGVRQPIVALANEHNEKETYVRDTIAVARRKYHLLTPSGQGRAGGQLSPKAVQLLEEHERKKEVAGNGPSTVQLS